VGLRTHCFISEQENKAIWSKGYKIIKCVLASVPLQATWIIKVTSALPWSHKMAKSMEDVKSQFDVRLRNKQVISTFSENNVGIC